MRISHNLRSQASRQFILPLSFFTAAIGLTEIVVQPRVDRACLLNINPAFVILFAA